MDHGQCIPCSDYCNGHAHTCVEKLDTGLSDTLNIMNDPNTILMQNDGPLSDAYCINCLDNTTGPTCSGCLPGHFRGSTDKREPCRQVLHRNLFIYLNFH